MGKGDRPRAEGLSGRRWSRKDLSIMLLVAVVALGVYANSLPNEFVYDDRPICLDDERTQDLGRIKMLFTRGYWGASDESIDGLEGRPRPLYRPVTLLSFAFNHAVTERPAGYRVVNLVLHAGVAASVVALCLVLFARRPVALVAGLVFAVHPVHTEAVVPIVGRSELLAALTALLAVVLHLQDALRNRTSPLSWRYVTTLALFLIGVFSKESAITTAGLIVGADVWLKFRGWRWARKMSWPRYLRRRLLDRYLGFLVVIGCFLAARWFVLGQLFSSAEVIPVSQNILMTATLGERLLTCLYVLAKYLYLLLIPHPLCYDYSARAVEIQTTLFATPPLIGLACLAAMVVAGIWSVRRRGEVAVAVVFFVITYSVASNVLVRIGTLMAERLVYLPSVAVCLLWGLLAGAVLNRWRRPLRLSASMGLPISAPAAAAVVGLGALLAAYGVLTVRRNMVWQSNRVLYETDVKTQPSSYLCWYNLGLLCFKRGDRATGLRYLEEALRLAPNSYEILGRMGWERARQGRVAEAIKLLERAAEQSWRVETFTLWTRAQLHQSQGNLDEAVRLYEATLEIKPDHQISLVNLTGIHANADSGKHYDLDKAYTYASRAARLPAPQPQVFVALADVCVKAGRRDEARRTIRLALARLNAYRAKVRQMGKLDALAPTYDRLEQALRRMSQTLDAEAPTTAP